MIFFKLGGRLGKHNTDISTNNIYSFHINAHSQFSLCTHESYLRPPNEFKSNIYSYLAQFLISIKENMLFCY